MKVPGECDQFFVAPSYGDFFGGLGDLYDFPKMASGGDILFLRALDHLRHWFQQAHGVLVNENDGFPFRWLKVAGRGPGVGCNRVIGVTSHFPALLILARLAELAIRANRFPDVQTSLLRQLGRARIELRAKLLAR